MMPRFDARVNGLAANNAVREAVAITSVGGVSWDEAMRMPRSMRHAYLSVYQELNPPPDEPDSNE